MSNLYDEYSQFRRLHPLTLLYGLIRNLPYIIITLYLAFFQRQTEEIIYILIFILIGMIVVPAHILRWYYFSFMINEKEIIIKSGVFSRQTRNIPIERVQNVNVKQDLLHRIFGIAKVQIETAGDVMSEGSLEFVKIKDADEINRIIRTYQKNFINQANSNQTDTASVTNDAPVNSETYNPSESGEVLFSMSPKDVFTYGMVRLRPLFLIYGVWAMSYISQYKFLKDIFEGYFGKTIESFADMPLPNLILSGLAFLLFSILISWIVDIVWTFTQFYGFRLIRDGNKLLQSYGLLSKISITIPLKKLQQITISTNPIKKKFDFYTMSLHTAGFDIYKKTANSGIPLAKKNILIDLTQKIYPVTIPETFKSISRKSIRRAFVRYLLFLIIPIVAGYLIFDWYVAFILLTLPVFYYAAVLRWQFRGYQIADDLIFVKQGFWVQKLNIIPIEKIQTLHIRETFFQRRLGLATLFIDTASSFNINDAVIPDIDGIDALDILNDLNTAFNDSMSKDKQKVK